VHLAAQQRGKAPGEQANAAELGLDLSAADGQLLPHAVEQVRKVLKIFDAAAYLTQRDAGKVLVLGGNSPRQTWNVKHFHNETLRFNLKHISYMKLLTNG
jgi:hypothetical protein